MLEDKTYKVKVWDHCDAVIHVYERHSELLNSDDAPENHKWKHWKETITVIPVSIDGSFPDHEEDLINDLKVAVDALAELYSKTPDYDVGIEYTINTHQYVNI
tara:strand:+ start:206 stop:514 length:309 start_codon:yes stop_codon:yes gene_type:complete